MKQMASNATVWMAAPSVVKGGVPARATTVNQEILRFLALYFGSLCLFLLLLSVGFALRGDTSWRTVILISVFVLVNAALYYWSLRSTNPMRVLIVQTVIGGILCPLVYLYSDGKLAPWWPGYAVMAFSGAIAWGLNTDKPLWGRLVLLYYLLNYAIATFLAVPHPDFYDLGLRIGLIGLTGLMLIQLTEILSQSLSKVYERSLQHRRAKEELQELTRLKTDFFANVSHEFRTPITLTLGPLESVLKGRHGEIGEELRGQIGIMIRNQQRLLGLINQILDVSKVEAGAVQLKAALIPDFNRFVHERVESFRPTAEARRIALKNSYDPLVKGMEIYIDREKIDKVILNLLSNSLKFTKQGHIEVITEIQGERLLIKVNDTGIGIRESELPHVFDRFRQADGSDTREFAGTGLGLALVKEFAKLHGGDVTVKSRYGEGTSFQVMLPLGKAHLSPNTIVEFVEDESTAATLALAESPTSESETQSNCAELNAEVERLYDSEKATLVCAEDNPELRYFLRDLLMDSYNVFVGANGKEGLELAKQRHPDMILSDLMMPVMSGLDFCRKIREDPALRSIPFVLLTAKTLASSKLEGLEGGADDYLTKPFSEAELLARVKNLVALRRQQIRLARELEAARAIQASLLPKPPQTFAGGVIDYFYHPSEQLSGDFCDILPKGDWIYFYLADVTSHGTASAQVTYLLKEIFSQLVDGGSGDWSLAEFVREAQRRYAIHKLEYDVAIQIARFHVGKKTLEVLRASAPAPLKVSQGQPENLRVKPSPALSAAPPGPADQYHPAEFTLQSGDTVYFFTDGCYEFPAAEGEFNLRRFHPLLAAAPDGDKWKDSIFEALAAAHGSAVFPDDLTFLRLKLN